MTQGQITRVGIVAKQGLVAAADHLERLAGWLQRRGLEPVFDADTAGEQASARTSDLLGPRWRPIPLPAGCDLNDLGRRPDGRALFFELLESVRTRPKAGGNHAA